MRTGLIDPLYWDKTKDNIVKLTRLGILDWINTTLNGRNYSFFENMELNYEIIKNLLKGEPVLFKFKIQDQIGEDEEAETISTRNTMAIVVKPELSTKIELSKIANKLRDSVSLSIVIGVIEDEDKKLISIHTRSNGRISAAELMDYFGGGGNPNMASAQIPYIEDIQSVRNKVLESPLLKEKVKRIERLFKI